MKKILTIALCLAPSLCFALGLGNSMSSMAGSGSNKLVAVQATDSTGPILTLPTGTTTGATTATGTVLTDEGNGVLDCLASVNATELAATIEAATLHQQTVATAGTKTCNFTGLTQNTTYYAHYFQRDAAGNASNVVSSLQFTTQSSGANPNITPSVAVNRTTCAAPCAIYFDASGTTSSATIRPIHDLEYTWNFGDSDTTSTWAYGRTDVNEVKNEDIGFQASHVFESGGTFSACLTVSDGTTPDTPSCTTITVTAADTQWAGTDTVCFSTNGTFTDCPSGATQVTTSDADAAINTRMASDRRFLFRCGQTFDQSASIPLSSAGPGMIGVYGSCGNAIFNATASLTPAINPQADDWRLVGITLDGNGATYTSAEAVATTTAGVDDFLALDVVAREAKFGVKISSTGTIDGLFFVDSEIGAGAVSGSTGGNGFFLSPVSQVAILGSLVDRNSLDEHGIRTHKTQQGVISHNTVRDVVSGKVMMTFRGGTYVDSTSYTEDIYVGWNDLDASSGGACITFGSQDPNNDQRARNFIVEGNYLHETVNMCTIEILQPEGTVRNNIGYFPSTSAFSGTFISSFPYGNNSTPPPTNVGIYNNSVYVGSTSTSGGLSFAWLRDTNDNTQHLDQSTFWVKNNLWYAPSATNDTFYYNVYNDPILLLDMTNNSCNTRNCTTNLGTNPYAATPSGLSSFTLNGAAYGANAGTAVNGVTMDAFTTPRTGTMDMGAVNY